MWFLNSCSGEFAVIRIWISCGLAHTCGDHSHGKKRGWKRTFGLSGGRSWWRGTVSFCLNSRCWFPKELHGCPSSSLQPCRTPAARFTDLSRFPRALYTKALFLRTRTAALPTASPAPGMDFPAIQTALCLRPGPPTPWTPPLAMAFHLRSVPCFQTDDVLYTRTK